MRVFRTILGMLLLAIGLPSLLAGAGLWAAMQHRDQGGAFSGELQRLSTPGYAFVVPDVDRLLRADASFTRIGDTQLRLRASTPDGPAFVGLAPTAEVQRYLTGVPFSVIRTVDIGTGALPVATNFNRGRTAPATDPGQASFWTRSGAGQVAWTPGEVTGGPYSLVVMSADARPGLQVSATAELRPGWLNSSTWGLLTLGTLLLMIGLITLAWPARRREIVYVVEPSQVPDLMAAIGAPLPTPALPARRPGGGAHRPRTLADTRTPARAALPPADPQFDWPPAAEPALAHSLPAGHSASPRSGAGSPSAAPLSPAAPSDGAGGVGASTSPVGAGSRPAAHSEPVALSGPAQGGSAAPAGSASSPAGLASQSAGLASPAGLASSAGLTSPQAGPGSPAGRQPVAPPTAAEYAAATAIPARTPGPHGQRTPAPGEPLTLIGAQSAPPTPDPLFGGRPERNPRRQAPAPTDIPMFRASAVGAWVAETAPARARDTEAQAAARVAEAARRRAAAMEGAVQAGAPGVAQAGAPGVAQAAAPGV
ncbi:hypothetical protein AB0J83_20690, partial [Actinoplanes sp. NPDC049596]